MRWCSFWFDLLFIPVYELLVFTTTRPISITLFGVRAGEMRQSVALLLGIFLFVTGIWSYRTLTTPRVRELFGLEADNEGATPSEQNRSLR